MSGAPAAAAAALLARAVRVEHGCRAVLDVGELAVRRGETLSIVGPNGAGKSTLLRVLGLLETPTRGDVWFGGERVTGDPAQSLVLRRRMAVVFQDPLLCRATVSRNVGLGLRLRRVAAGERRARVAEWLERFGIGALARRHAHGLSGGEAQRASLARAFVLRPEVLLLDEPFRALDPPTRQSLVAELQQLLAETHTTTVFVTHDRDEAFALGDRVVVLLDGRVAQIGSPDEVAGRPLDEAVARFVGIDNLIPGDAAPSGPGAARIRAGALELSVADPRGVCGAAWACVRAEDVSLLVDEAPPPPGSCNLLSGTVRSLRAWGTQVRVTVDCGIAVTALTTKPAAEALGLAPGKPVRLAFPARSVHVIRRGAA